MAFVGAASGFCGCGLRPLSRLKPLPQVLQSIPPGSIAFVGAASGRCRGESRSHKDDWSGSALQTIDQRPQEDLVEAQLTGR